MTLKNQMVFVIDGASSTRNLLSRTVQSKKMICRLFGSAEELLDAVDGKSRGCIVASLELPGMGGLELQRELTKRRVGLPMIALSPANGDLGTVVRAMQQGAMTVLQRPCDPDELLEAIRQALRFDRETYRERSRVARAHARYEALNARDRKIMKLVVEGVPNKTIAKKCDIGLRTVEGRRHRIFHQMEVHSLVELVRLALLMGISPGCLNSHH